MYKVVRAGVYFESYHSKNIFLYKFKDDRPCPFTQLLYNQPVSYRVQELWCLRPETFSCIFKITMFIYINLTFRSITINSKIVTLCCFQSNKSTCEGTTDDKIWIKLRSLFYLFWDNFRTSFLPVPRWTLTIPNKMLIITKPLQF